MKSDTKCIFQIIWTIRSCYMDLERVYLEFYLKGKKKEFVQETAFQLCIRYIPHWIVTFIFVLVIQHKISLWTTLTVLLPVMIIMELMQFLLFYRRHFKFVENWMELGIIILSKYNSVHKMGKRSKVYRKVEGKAVVGCEPTFNRYI